MRKRGKPQEVETERHSLECSWKPDPGCSSSSPSLVLPTCHPSPTAFSRLLNLDLNLLCRQPLENLAGVRIGCFWRSRGIHCTNSLLLPVFSTSGSIYLGKRSSHARMILGGNGLKIWTVYSRNWIRSSTLLQPLWVIILGLICQCPLPLSLSHPSHCPSGENGLFYLMSFTKL